MTQPMIVIAGEPPWLHDVTAALREQYQVHHQAARSGYMNTLINERAALVLVDGHHADWHLWTTTPKTSPATRRIPIVLISDEAEIRAQAAVKGADLSLPSDGLAGKINKIVTDYARLPDPVRVEQLDCDCQDALPPLAVEGVQRFNAGEYYQQHDLFEEQWVNTTSPVRDLYRAVLQVGVAYYQIERGNYRGALKMLQRSVQWLTILPDTCQGIDVAQLREDSYRVRAELERLGEENLDQFDHALIKGVKLVERDA